MSEITLKRWTVYRPSHGIPLILASRVENHPHLGSGPYSHSSAVVWIEPERSLAMTLNTLYRLEEPHDVVFNDPEIVNLIRQLHPDNVPPEIRQAHAQRAPWPHTDQRNDEVYDWVISRWRPDLKR